MISVVIPAINESAGIGGVIERCHFAHEVVVVDGGSTDDTVSIARAAGANVIEQRHVGYGLALLTGFGAARGDIIATSDGDGTYPVELVPDLSEYLWKYEFISGCRFPLTDKNAMSIRNQIGNKVLTAVASILWRHRFQDVLSGMWVFKKSALSKMRLRSHTWNLSQEIKIEAMRHCRFKEIPIPYAERKGESKLIPWKVGLHNLAYMYLHRFELRL